jgi:hypothetical protein
MVTCNSTGELNVAKEVAAMERMTVDPLRARYAEVIGEGTNARNKQWLIKRIAWRLQAATGTATASSAFRREVPDDLQSNNLPLCHHASPRAD